MNYRSTLRKRLFWTLLISGVIVCIIVGIIAAAIYKYTPIYHPISIMKGLRTGIAWKFLIIFILALWSLITWLNIKDWKNNLFHDKLPKNRHFVPTIQEHGSSHFAEPFEYSDVVNIRPVKECKGVPLAQLTGDYTQTLDFYGLAGLPNRNILCIASSGSGKTSCGIKPYAYCCAKDTMRHSVVITDPKGEVFLDLAKYFEQKGYIVRRLNFCDVQKSDGWDMFRFIRDAIGDETLLADRINYFCNAVVSNLNLQSKDTIFISGGTSLLRALIFYVMLNDNIKEEDKKISYVMDMLHQGEPTYLATVFEDAKQNAKLLPAVTAYNTIKQASQNLYGNIVTNLTLGLNSLETKPILRVLTTDDINLEDIGKRPYAVFVNIPTENPSYRFVSAAFYTMLLHALQSSAVPVPGTSSPRLINPVDLILDEFGNIGMLPNFPTDINMIRSYGITAFIATQSLGQIEEYYGVNGRNSIISACSTWLNFGFSDTIAAKLFCEMIGETTYVKKEGDIVKTYQDDLMSTSDLTSLGFHDVVVKFQNINPIYGKKVHISKVYPDFENSPKFYDSEYPNINDVVARRRRHEAEERRLESYYQNHSSAPVEMHDSYDVKINYPDLTTMQLLGLLLKDVGTSIRSKFRIKKKVVKQVEETPDDLFGGVDPWSQKKAVTPAAPQTAPNEEPSEAAQPKAETQPAVENAQETDGNTSGNEAAGQTETPVTQSSIPAAQTSETSTPTYSDPLSQDKKPVTVKSHTTVPGGKRGTRPSGPSKH